MSDQKNIEKTSFKIGESDVPGLKVMLPTKDGELTEFSCFEDSEEAIILISNLIESWNDLWKDIETLLEEGIKDYNTGQVIGGEGFSGTFQLAEEDDWDGTVDCIVGFYFLKDVPGWDFSLKEGQIVEHQAVF